MIDVSVVLNVSVLGSVAGCVLVALLPCSCGVASSAAVVAIAIATTRAESKSPRAVAVKCMLHLLSNR